MNAEEILTALEVPAPPPANSGKAVASIPTGSLALDNVLSTHGWPLRQISHIFGDPMTGKSTLLYHSIAEAQKAGHTVALCPMHNDFDPDYAAALGIRLQDLLIIRASEGIGMLANWEMVIAVDGVDDQNFLNRVTGTTGPWTTLLVSTQIAYGWPRSGGAHLGRIHTPVPHRSAVRVRLKPAGPVMGGTKVTAVVWKDNYAPPADLRDGGDPEAHFKVRYGEGIDTLDEMLILGNKFGLIRKAGNYRMLDGQSFNGRDQAISYLEQHPEFADKLHTEIRAQIDRPRIHQVI